MATIDELIQGLGTDPTPMFQPGLDALTKQREQAQTIYGDNRADITNIFGNLTQIRQADEARIRSQFEQSIKSQQEAAASRTAAVRAGQAASATAMGQAMSERGGGPALVNPASSKSAQAAEAGIADANKYQTIWEGMQNTIGAQTQADLLQRIAGYGNQQTNVLTDLQRSLDARLGGIDASEADMKSKLAQARQESQRSVIEAQLQRALDLENRSYQASRSSGAPQAPDYGKGIQGIVNEIDALGGSSADFMALMNPIIGGANTADQAYRNWVTQYGDKYGAYADFAWRYLSTVLPQSSAGDRERGSTTPGVTQWPGATQAPGIMDFLKRSGPTIPSSPTN